MGLGLLPDLDNSDLWSNFALHWETLTWNCASMLKSMHFQRGPCRVCWVLQRSHGMRTQHVHPAHRQLGGRRRLAHSAAVWEVGSFFKSLRTRLHEGFRLTVVVARPCCPELWGWERDRRTGQISKSSSLPVVVEPVGALQENSDSG